MPHCSPIRQRPDELAQAVLVRDRFVVASCSFLASVCYRMAQDGHDPNGASVASQSPPPGLRPVLDAPGGGGLGATVGSTYNKATRDFIEAEVLLNFDRMLVDTPAQIDGFQGGAVWRQLQKDLKLLGFNMDEEDGWDLLGLCKYEGPEPDKATIARRAGLLNDLLGTTSDSSLEPSEQAMRAKWICRVGDAKAQCTDELKEVQTARQQAKTSKDRLPRWAEADAAVVEHVLEEVDGESICMLNLSNVLRSHDPHVDGHHVAAPPLAR